MRVIDVEELKGRDFYKVPELATKLKVTPEYIYTLLKQGKLYGERVGSEWRIPVEAVVKLFEMWNNPIRKKRRKVRRKDPTLIIAGVVGMLIGVAIGVIITLILGGVK